MRKNSISALLVLGCGWFSAGCGAEAGPEYQGETLFSLTGSVSIQTENVPANLVPAVAFRDKKEDWLYVTDAMVTGEFPARFTLDVYERPAAVTILFPEDDHKEPAYAIGAIVAIAADHPGTVPATDDARQLEEQCTSDGCHRRETWCSEDHASCYHRDSDCDAAFESCQTASESGDPALAHLHSRYVAGLSRDYRVLYLAETAPADSFLAGTVNGRKALTAGYHLLELEELTDAEQRDNEACFEAASAELLARYNAQQGTSYQSWDEAYTAEPDTVFYDADKRKAALERGCVLTDSRARVVASNESNPVNVTISPDVQLIRFD